MKAGLKPAEIAAQCEVTSNTIRNWSKEFRSHLSEGANAAERAYTDRDSTVLRYISTLKQEGMKAHEIAERLAEMSFGETESPEIKSAPIVPSEAPQDLSEKQNLTPALIVALETINAMQRRLEAIEASVKETKQIDHKLLRDAFFLVLAGAVGALVLVLILIVVVDLWAK